MNRAYLLLAIVAGCFLSACGFQPDAGTTESVQNAGVIESPQNAAVVEAVPVEAKGIDGAWLFADSSIMIFKTIDGVAQVIDGYHLNDQGDWMAENWNLPIRLERNGNKFFYNGSLWKLSPDEQSLKESNYNIDTDEDVETFGRRLTASDNIPDGLKQKLGLLKIVASPSDEGESAREALKAISRYIKAQYPEMRFGIEGFRGQAGRFMGNVTTPDAGTDYGYVMAEKIDGVWKVRDVSSTDDEGIVTILTNVEQWYRKANKIPGARLP